MERGVGDAIEQSLKFDLFLFFLIVLIWALLRYEIFLDFATVSLSFVCGKYCLIMDYIGSKDSSRDLQANCVISFCFRLYLMLHACAARFDVTKNLENFLVFEVN